MTIARELPGPGQESVWDYPRPPTCVLSEKHVVVRLGDTVVADSRRAFRVLETSHPPTWYVPRADVADHVLRPSSTRSTFCEWKGDATYWDVLTGDGASADAASADGASADNGVRGAAWSYEHPTAGFAAITGALTFYPSRFECFVDGEPVRPQEGGFYGGWITDDVVGPFKGGPGSWGW